MNIYMSDDDDGEGEDYKSSEGRLNSNHLSNSQTAVIPRTSLPHTILPKRKGPLAVPTRRVQPTSNESPLAVEISLSDPHPVPELIDLSADSPPVSAIPPPVIPLNTMPDNASVRNVSFAAHDESIEIDSPNENPLYKILRKSLNRISKSYTPRKRFVSVLLCSGCGDNDAEYAHPILSVPLCGVCLKQHRDATYVTDPSLVDKNTSECLWCGRGDGTALLMCDGCIHSVCEACCTRNFGLKEMLRVRELKEWLCYKCNPVAPFKALQLPADYQFFNMDVVFSHIRAPPPTQLTSLASFDTPQQLVELFSPGEARLASLFSRSFDGDQLVNLLIADRYLLAQDLPVLGRLSKNLRIFFSRHILLLPGLFKSPFGEEHGCQLHPHQYDSLKRMIAIENCNTEFGALRGGIFADAPGLGKTVTAMALILSSAGVLPKEPKMQYSENEANKTWSNLDPYSQHQLGRSAMYKAVVDCASEPIIPRQLENLKPLFDSGAFSTIAAFEQFVRRGFRRFSKNNPRKEAVLLESFRLKIASMKEGLDKKSRSKRCTAAYSRMKQELALRPSSATLVIVPMSLLEHWYEQISRHIGLGYLVHRLQSNLDVDNEDLQDSQFPGLDGFDISGAGTALHDSIKEGKSGIVYFDGLGDILEITPPLSKTRLADSAAALKDCAELGQYTIVVTTFERCAAEYEKSRHLSSLGGRRDDLSMVTSRNHSILSLRWLRLIVDEGHELGTQSSKFGENVAAYINEISAERRWVMSGTPTTGSSSRHALIQVQRLLSFLRHPKWGVNAISEDDLLDACSAGADGRDRINSTENDNMEEEDGSGAQAGLLQTPTTSSGTKRPRSAIKPAIALQRSAFARWEKLILLPFLDRQDSAKNALISLMKSLVIRHTKDDIKLFQPLRRTELVDPDVYKTKKKLLLRVEEGDGSMNIIDEVKADYIFETISEHRKLWRAGKPDVHGLPARRPKVIVFAAESDTTHLQGVASYLYNWMGDSSICEHGTSGSTSARAKKYLAEARSSEISRFRSSKRKTRSCPLCGFENVAHGNDNTCKNMLYLVEYNALPGEKDMVPYGNAHPSTPSLRIQQDEVTQRCSQYVTHPPTPAGHGWAGRGGHFVGRCLCSYEGCPPDTATSRCHGYPNAFYKSDSVAHSLIESQHNWQNLALVAKEDIAGFVQGQELTWRVNQPVFVVPRPRWPARDAGDEKENDELIAQSTPATVPSSPSKTSQKTARIAQRKLIRQHARGPLLWEEGVMGGMARLRQWMSCGKTSATGFHKGGDILEDVEWIVQEEDASVLLLQEDGSTGLDLSFATHIFLLNHIKDPALEDQIISRANRMGATGPVEVITLLSNSEEDD